MSDFPIENKNNINSTHLLAFFYKWRKTILAVAVISLISSAGVAWMIPEKFKSTVILFPATSTSISKSLMSQNSSPQSDLLQFGEEDDMERMLQVLNSEEISSSTLTEDDLQLIISKSSKLNPDIIAARRIPPANTALAM